MGNEAKLTTDSRKMSYFFLTGLFFFLLGLIIFPNIQLQILEGSTFSPFTLMGIIFFVFGALKPFYKKIGRLL